MRHEKRRDRWSGAEWRVEEEEVKDQLFSRTWGDGEEKKKKREKRKSEKREDFCTALCPHSARMEADHSQHGIAAQCRLFHFTQFKRPHPHAHESSPSVSNFRFPLESHDGGKPRK